MYYKVDKNKDSIFFQAVYTDAILYIAFLYFWTDRKKATSFLPVEMERIMCEKNNHWWCWGLDKEISTRFQIIQVSCEVRLK